MGFFKDKFNNLSKISALNCCILALENAKKQIFKYEKTYIGGKESKIKEVSDLNIKLESLINEAKFIKHRADYDMKVIQADDLEGLQVEYEIKEIEYKAQINNLTSEYEKKELHCKAEINKLNMEYEKKLKESQTQINKLSKISELYRSINYSITHFQLGEEINLPEYDIETLDELSPTIETKLHCMDVKALKKEFIENNKQIDKVLKMYSSRYTTKTNAALYKLMVLALKSELNNILTNLKYEKLDTGLQQIKDLTTKYLKITTDGNQTIAPTLTKFIGQIEYLFSNAVHIEYKYYVKREQARQEQLAIRQQMREEAEERRILEEQRKQVEMEEEKFHNEITKLQSLLVNTVEDTKILELKNRILELQNQLENVSAKKEEIIKLQNGKAGNVYIISNLGSFGENIFKIGMTRRIDPQDRINELGSASVPFKFNVHSFIFSDDAVSLENKLHNMLNSKRVNKVNRRKEFFYTTIDELEQLVTDIEPTAEFNKTMISEEYNQSLSYDSTYDNLTDDVFMYYDEDDFDIENNDTNNEEFYKIQLTPRNVNRKGKNGFTYS